jgi:HupE / UreJ protein
MTFRFENARVRQFAMLTVLVLAASAAAAHGVAQSDQEYLQQVSGPQVGPFMYLGAKHMITGYDHLLFLAGVIFFLYRLRQVAAYVTMFAIGHSTTLVGGILLGTNISSHLVDAIIGLSIVYKALDNVRAFETWFGWRPEGHIAVLFFGLFHGFGLATKLQDFGLKPDGLLTNLISFNLGVEIGQMLALTAILIAMNFWRRTPSFVRNAFRANVVLMTAGFVLTGYQLAGYWILER